MMFADTVPNTLRKTFQVTLLATAFLTLAAAPTLADEYLMYGPSLAVWLQDNGAGGPVFHSSFHPNHSEEGLGGENPFLSDESHFATEAGHNVTIVDAVEWAAMTTEEFAAFDAIVIGDAGCDFDNGPLLDPINATKTTWSPAVTGHLFLHTFDNIYHFNQNSPPVDPAAEAQFQAMVDLAVKGMEYAASAGATGLYYANGCRSDFDSSGGVPTLGGGEPVEIFHSLELFSLLTSLDATLGDHDGDVVEVVDTEHPVMAFFTDAALSEWSNSYHAQFEGAGSLFDILSIDPVGSGATTGDQDAVIVATRSPLGQAIVFADGFESGTTGGWTQSVGEVLPPALRPDDESL